MLYDIIDKRSGKKRVADSIDAMLSKSEVVKRRNAAFVLLCKAHNRRDGKAVDFYSGSYWALRGLLEV